MNYARWLQLRGPMITRAPDDEGAESQTSTEGADEAAGEDGEDDAGGEEDAEGEAGEESEAAAEGAEAAAGEDGEDEVGQQPARVPWQVKRLAKVTAAAKAAEARAAALAEENEALKDLAGRGDGGGDTSTSTTTAQPGARVYTEAEFQAEAARRAGVTTLNQKVDVIYDKAVELDPKFTERLGPLREAVGEDLAKRPDFFKALTKLDNGAEVINALSKNLDHFSEILEGDPVDLALELAKMDRQVKKAPGGTPAPSRAGTTHRPPKTIDTSTTPAPDLEKMSEEEYSQIRAKQRQARHEARGGW